VPDRCSSTQVVELALLLGRRVGIGEGRGKADAFEWVLRVTLERLGRLDAEALVDRRDDVDRVRVLAPYSRLRDVRRPRHDHRVRGPTLVVRVALPELEWRVERPRPTGRIVVVGERRAEDVEVLQVLFDGVGYRIEKLVLVDRTVRATFTRRAVVGHEDDHR